MSTTYISVVGAMSPLPNFPQNPQRPTTPIPITGRTIIPPAPLPQTLYGSTTQTSYST